MNNNTIKEKIYCKNCKYFHRLKELKKNGKWNYKDCCVVLTKDRKDGDDYNAFVLVVDKNDCCEMYYEK